MAAAAHVPPIFLELVDRLFNLRAIKGRSSRMDVQQRTGSIVTANVWEYMCNYALPSRL